MLEKYHIYNFQLINILTLIVNNCWYVSTVISISGIHIIHYLSDFCFLNMLDTLDNVIIWKSSTYNIYLHIETLLQTHADKTNTIYWVLWALALFSYEWSSCSVKYWVQKCSNIAFNYVNICQPYCYFNFSSQYNNILWTVKYQYT